MGPPPSSPEDSPAPKKPLSSPENSPAPKKARLSSPADDATPPEDASLQEDVSPPEDNSPPENTPPAEDASPAEDISSPENVSLPETTPLPEATTPPYYPPTPSYHSPQEDISPSENVSLPEDTSPPYYPPTPRYHSPPEEASQSSNPPPSEQPPSVDLPLTGRWEADEELPTILIISATGTVEGGLDFLQRIQKNAILYSKTPDEVLDFIGSISPGAIWITDDSLLNDPQYEKTTEEIKEYISCGGTLVLCGVRSSSGDRINPPTHPRRWLMEVMEMFWRYPADDAPVDAVIIRHPSSDPSLQLWSSMAKGVMGIAADKTSKKSRLPRRILQLLPPKVFLPRYLDIPSEVPKPYKPPETVEPRIKMRPMPPGLYGTCQPCSGWIHYINCNSALVPDGGEINQAAQEIVATIVFGGASKALKYNWEEFAQDLHQFGRKDEIIRMSQEEWKQHIEDSIPRARTLYVDITSDDQHEEETRDGQHEEETRDNQLDEETSDNHYGEGTRNDQYEEETSNDQYKKETSDNQQGEETSDDQLDEETNNNQHEQTSDDQHEEDTSDNQHEEETSNDEDTKRRFDREEDIAEDS